MPRHFADPLLAFVIAAVFQNTARASTGADQAVVPRVELSVINQRVKYAVTDEIRIEGEVTQELIPPYTPLFEWSVFESESQTPLDVTVVTTRGSSPSLTILPNALQPSKIYSVRLVATLPFGSERATMSAELSVETAGVPSMGSFDVSPLNGTSATRRVLSARGWSATALPLSYTFGYVNAQGRRVYLHAPPLTVYGLSSRLGEAGWAAVPRELPELLEVDELPVGDPLSDYALSVFVDVCTPFGACSGARQEVQSRPVDGNTTSTQQLRAAALSSASASRLRARLQPLLAVCLVLLCAVSLAAVS